MKYIIFLFIFFVFFAVFVPSVLAKALIPGQQSTIQPMPQDIAPNISHNVNSTATSYQVQQNQWLDFGSELNPIQSTFSSQSPIAKNHTIIFVLVFIFSVLGILFLVFLYFKK